MYKWTQLPEKKFNFVGSNGFAFMVKWGRPSKEKGVEEKEKHRVQTTFNISHFLCECKSLCLIAIKMEIEEIQSLDGLDCGYNYIASHRISFFRTSI